MRDRVLAAVRARLERYVRTGDPQVVLSKDAFLESALLLPEIADEARGFDLEVCHALGWLYWFRYLAGDDGPDSSELSLALTLLGPVCQVDPDAVPEPARAYLEEVDPLSVIAMRSLREAFAGDDPRLLDTAIDALRLAIAGLPQEHPNWARQVSNLNLALDEKFRRTADLGALAEAVTTGRQAVTATAAGDPSRPGRLSNLANSLRSWSGTTGGPPALEEAVELLREAVRTAPDSNPNKGGYSANLSSALHEWFERAGNPDLLAEAASAGRAAVAATADDDPELPTFLVHLRNLLWQRFEWTSDQQVLVEMVATCRRIAAAAPDGDPDRATNLVFLSSALKAQFEHSADVKVLREAIDIGRGLVAASADDPEHRAAALTNLGSALQEWCKHHGELAAAKEAVAVVREAMALTASTDPNRATLHNNLSNALQLLFQLNGELTVLDEAVAAGRAAVAATTDTGAPLAVCLANLGNALNQRYAQTNELSTLDEAVTCKRESIAQTPAGHPDLVRRLSNLSGALLARYLRTDEPPALREAVEAGRRAVGMLPRDHPYQAMYLSNFGNALVTWFHRSGELAALNEAVECLRKVVTLTPESSPSLGSRLHHLGRALLIEFEHAKDPAKLDEAAAVGRRAVAVTDENHPGYADVLIGLGNTLRSRHEHIHDPAASLEAVELLRTAALLKTATPHQRLLAGSGWGILAMAAGKPHSALEGFATALQMLPLVSARRIARADAEYQLAQLPGLASEAAACALMADDPAQAVTLLEQGRGVLLARALESRTDLTGLRTRDPHRAERFEWLCTQLESTDGAGSVRESHRELADELDALISDIRTLPGHERFLLPPTLPELLAETARGPVVLVNVSQYRCDALILTPGGVRVLELDLTFNEAGSRAVAFLAALFEVHDSHQPVERRQKAQEAVVATLRWLWDTITGPVLTELGRTETPTTDWPRIWWSPASFLSFLPLHAAGYHDEHGQPNARTVLDRAVSSYTPTVRALAQARTSPSGPVRALVVAMPHTPGAPDLPGAQNEAKIVSRTLPGACVLTGEQATRDEILARLATSTWAHFACHGATKWDDPSRGLLLVHDYAARPLSVLDISRLHLDHAELAFLSACDTARGGLKLPDEALHMTAAFQLAGYRNVIGTLWTIIDQLAVDLTEQIYTTLTANDPDATRAPFAVHAATRALRDRYPDAPSLWAAHIHVGR